MASETSFAFPIPIPTRPFPSPTATSALNLRCLPPLTTLATRFTEINFSVSSSLASSSSCTISLPNLEFQSGFSRRLGQCLHPSMISIPSPVKDNLGQPFLNRPLPHQLANHGGHLRLALPVNLQLRVLARRAHNRLPFPVIDYLRIDVVQTPVHTQTRSRLKQMLLSQQPGSLLHYSLHDPIYFLAAALPALPGFRRIFSPAYLMPFPLYESHFRIALNLAATSPTSSLSTPTTFTRFVPSTAKEIPGGGSTSTGWVNPD